MISLGDSCSSPFVKNYVDVSARLLLLSAYNTSELDSPSAALFSVPK